MKETILSFVVGVITVGATLFALYVGIEATVTSGSQEVSASTLPVSATSTLGLPVRLTIPRLGIEATVQTVGLAPSGNIAVPRNYTDVAWYNGSAVPGQKGVAVFDGHVDNGLGLPGVFKNLAEIQQGTEIDLFTKEGTVKHFMVTHLESYPYDNVPMNDILTAQEPSIRLITCEGTWVPSSKTYSNRLVATAVLEE